MKKAATATEKFGSGKKEEKDPQRRSNWTRKYLPPHKPPKKKKYQNPLKKELSNPQGLDFANQAGALMAQPSKVEMLPPKDMTRESTKPERTTSGVTSESTKVLRCKANMFDITRKKKLHF